MIPSLSWAYTAGNQYRLNKVLGSLTLGGYDRSKSEPNSLNVAFNEQVRYLSPFLHCWDIEIAFWRRAVNWSGESDLSEWMKQYMV